MKKFILLFSSLFLINISCTNNDDKPTNQEPPLSTEGTLLRRTVSVNNGNQSTADYYYLSGNKVKESVGNNGSKVTWTYAGNLIVEQNFYRDNVLKQKEIYQYDTQERMIQRKMLTYSNNSGYRSEYTYNSDGTVTIAGYNGDLNTQTNYVTNNKVYLFPNGDVQKIEFHVVVNGVNHVRTREYAYDDKNYSMNGILNYNKIKVWETGTYGNTHNNTSITYSTTESNSPTYTNDVTYTYNSQGYPITSSAFAGSMTTQHFYQ